METNKTTATQGAERLPLSALNHLDTTEYETITDEYGDVEGTTRPNREISATLSHETEDYIRIIKTLTDILPVYAECLRGTYYGGEQGNARYRAVLPLFQQLREEIGHDMGVCMADRLAKWQEEYL